MKGQEWKEYNTSWKISISFWIGKLKDGQSQDVRPLTWIKLKVYYIKIQAFQWEL
jgi:hypothetical protein